MLCFGRKSMWQEMIALKRMIRAGIGCMMLVTAICLWGCGKRQNTAENGQFVKQNHETAQGEEHDPSDTGQEDGYDQWDTGQENGNDQPDLELDEEVAYACTEQETGGTLFDIDKQVTILFAGNSLLKTPDTCYYFDELVKRYHLLVDTKRELWDGMNIRYQVSLAEFEPDVAEEYRQADVVILQEYGSHYDTTYEDICELIKNYCKKDVVVYYYTTEFDEPLSYMKKLSENEKIHILDFGKVQHRLNEIPIRQEEEKKEMQEALGRALYGSDWEQLKNTNVYEMDVTMYDFLHKINDYHPNELNGFLAAAYIYTQLYKTSFEDYSYEELDGRLKNLLPGLTEEAKKDYYQEMIKILNEGVGLY